MPGLFALIFFTTFNNFLGGVFFALMDAYGLSLVSVEVWGTLWGVLSLSFILGGLYISKKGLGANPLRILFRNNIITWTVCIFFTIQPSITLLAVGTFIWMFFVPFTRPSSRPSSRRWSRRSGSAACSDSPTRSSRRRHRSPRS